MQPRLFLFYGTDSKASRAAVGRWETLFRQKYGDATKYIVAADEMSAPQLGGALTQYLEGQALFEVPKMIIIKRVTSQEKGPGYAYSKALIEVLKKNEKDIDESVTIALWEDRTISSTHPLLQYFGSLETKKKARINSFQIPSDREVTKVAQKYLNAQGVKIEFAALELLQKNYGYLGKKARLAKKLKANQELLEDERGWWLYQVLDTAILLQSGKGVTVELLESIHPAEEVPVSIFDLVMAISDRRWNDARSLLRRVEKEGDEGFYFSLYAALKWQLTRSSGGNAELIAYTHELLAEIEIIAKNFSLEPAWLAHVLVSRLEDMATKHRRQPILPFRKLWLAHLMRT